jgi:hypothetical protein
MMGNLKEDDIQKLHTTAPEQLTRNYSSVQFLRQTLPGNTLSVGTKNIPSVAVIGKGLTFDCFSDPLVRKAILVTVQCADSIITSMMGHSYSSVRV